MLGKVSKIAYLPIAQILFHYFVWVDWGDKYDLKMPDAGATCWCLLTSVRLCRPGQVTALLWKTNLSKYSAFPFPLKILPVSFRVTLSTFHCFRFISFVLKVHFEFLKFWDEGNVLTLKSSPSPRQSCRKMKIDCPDFNIFRSGEGKNRKVGRKMRMDDADFNIIGFALQLC